MKVTARFTGLMKQVIISFIVVLFFPTPNLFSSDFFPMCDDKTCPNPVTQLSAVRKVHRDYKYPGESTHVHGQLPTRSLPPTKAYGREVDRKNPTAPNVLTQTLSGDFTDSDGDGMTDAAEIKYGFNPYDPTSFPTEPAIVAAVPIPGSGIGAVYEVGFRGIDIRWQDPAQGSYFVALSHGNQTIYWGGHPAGYADVGYAQFNLQGMEILTGHFMQYDANGQLVKNYPNFTIDLSAVHFSPLGNSQNRISYTFKDFPADRELQYRNFLRRLFPLLYYYLGPPAESFNCVITNMGFDSNYFEITDNGRTFLSDTEFIPRLIAHEFVHAWKGHFVFSSDANWNYDSFLGSFEEATAEGTAFELMHEYVRSYPNDDATIQLLNWMPYQYWSSETTNYDSVKSNRDTGTGNFWDPRGLEYDKYSTAATTWQLMMNRNSRPNTYKDIMQRYFAKINGDSSWRPNRNDLIDMWSQEVPQVQGIALRDYLDAMPVFRGGYYVEGVYVLSVVRPYGSAGDHQYAATYADKDGDAWWGILQTQINDYHIPGWIGWMYSTPADAYIYINTQKQPFTVDLYNGLNEKTNSYQDRTDDWGDELGYGWKWVDALAMENYSVGLYRETVTFDNYIPHDGGAREDRYFFGLHGLNQDSYSEYVIMIGIDGVAQGSVTITINNIQYSQPIANGVAVFRQGSVVWPFDMEGEFPIVITRSDGVSHTYCRTIMEAGTIWNFFQYQFIIIDKDFNGIEDDIQAITTGVSATSLSFSSLGGGGNVKVSPPGGGIWAAVSNNDWITISSGSAGTGRGVVYFTVAPYVDTDFGRCRFLFRQGSLTVDNQTVTIQQACRPDKTPPSLTIEPVSTPTNQRSQTITGTVKAGATVYVAVDTGSAGHATITGTLWSYIISNLSEGTNAITVTATDLAGNSATVTASIVYSTLTITAVPLADGAVGTEYSQTLTASGGKAPYAWLIYGGDLPVGLRLSSATGVISGTPTTAGTWGFIVCLTDADSVEVCGYFFISVADSNSPVRILRATPAYYLTIASAYNAAMDGDVIEIKAWGFIEDVIFNRPVSVIVRGGYDVDYKTNVSFTVIGGSLTVVRGVLTIENIVIE